MMMLYYLKRVILLFLITTINNIPSFGNYNISCPDSIKKNRPGIELTRYSELYHYLENPQFHCDNLDYLKFIPLTKKRNTYISTGGEFRTRTVYYRNERFEPTGNDYFLLQRIMLHSDVWFGKNIRFFSQFKSGFALYPNRPPRGANNNKLDLHQIFGELIFGYPGGGVTQIRLGRQEILFGSSRLFFLRNAPSVRRSFDGIRMQININKWSADAFFASEVPSRPGIFDDDWLNNESIFWGFEIKLRNSKKIPETALYYLGFDLNQARYAIGSAMDKRHMAGLYFTLLPGKSIRLQGEFAFQGGRFGESPVQAWLAIAEVSYKPKEIFTYSLFSAIGSGNDGSPTMKSVSPPFPRAGPFGRIQLVRGYTNMIGIRPGVHLTSATNARISLFWYFYGRQKTSDAVYVAPRNPVRIADSEVGRFIGHQPSIQLGYQFSRYLSFQTEVTHFFSGPVISGSGANVNVIYADATILLRF